MKTFREFVNEETMPFAQTEKGFVGIDSPAVRDNINSLLAGVTDCEFITPYIALERVAKVLANFHIFLPKQTFLDADQGMVTIEINQFGEKIGATDSGEVVTQTSSPYYLYFEYEVDDNGTFEVFSEVVTEDELDEILSDMDEEDENESELDESVKSKIYEAVKKSYGDLKSACWKGYTAVGMKEKNGKKVPNCVPVDEAEGMHLDKPQKGKMADINKLNKEETLDEKLTDHQLYMNGAISRDEYEKRTGKGRYKKPDPKERYGVVNKNLVKTVKEEQLDELSKKTLGSYIKKSVEDKAHARSDKTIANYNRDEKKKKEASDVIAKRSKGIDMAVNKLTKEEKIDESKITHIVAKKDLSKHKKWMDSEGYDTHTKNLPKSHPKHETHVGIVSKSSVESSYHGDGHAEPIKEEQLSELSTAKLKDYKAKSFNYVRGVADGEADSKKVPNRFKGMELAKKKLATREKEIDNNIDRQMRSKRSDRFGIEEENLDEISKATLGSYIKKASHDVAAKSAAVRGFARDADAQRKDKKPMDARKSDERADKMFKKSWNRRQGMAKAVDKLTKEELSPADKGRIAAGYRGSVSNPAKQGAIAAYLDDQERDKKKQQKAKTPEKANFNVAKKLARQAVKAQKAKNK